MQPVMDEVKGEARPGTNERSLLDASSTPTSPVVTCHSGGSYYSWPSNLPLLSIKERLLKHWSSFARSSRPTESITDLEANTTGSREERQNGISEQDDPDDDEEDADEETLVRPVPKMPLGYPRLATFLDSDDNFMLYRRFGYIQSRLLLERQDNLRQLEDELDRMDRLDLREERKSPGDKLRTRREFHQPFQAERVALLERIENEWTKYASLLTSAQQMTAFNKPTAGEYKSVRTWMENVRPLYDTDARWVQNKEDLVTLRPGREYAWLDAGIEYLLRCFKCRAIEHIFRSKETRRKSDGKDGSVYYTRARIERLVVTIITFMIVVLLVVPIYLLYRLTDVAGSPRSNGMCIGVLLIFTLAFAACISLFTRAKRHEILAASAAYCAVLVVFIGNMQYPGAHNDQ